MMMMMMMMMIGHNWQEKQYCFACPTTFCCSKIIKKTSAASNYATRFASGLSLTLHSKSQI